MNYLFKRSSTPNKRPDPAAMTPGEVLMNNSEESPGLFFKNVNGSLVVAAPPYVGVTAPNSNPAGSAGNSPGEFWIDISDPLKAQLKVYTGSSWSLSWGNPIEGLTNFATRTSYIGVTIPTLPTGTDNTSVGFDSGKSLTTGGFNTLLGSNAGSTLTASNNCVGIGYQTLGSATVSPTLGDFAVAIGDLSMSQATNLSLCTAIGANTLAKNQGEGNTAVGCNALAANTTGQYNIAMGFNALTANITGSDNIAIGGNAMSNVDGCSDNICVGSSAGKFLKPGSTGNVMVGLDARANRDAVGVFTNNVFIGKGAGSNLLASVNNVCIGPDCLGGDSNPTSNLSNCVVIGSVSPSYTRGLGPLDGEILIGTTNVGLRVNKMGAVSFGPNNFGEAGAPLIQDPTSIGVGNGPTRWYNDGPQSTFVSADNKRITIKYGLVSEITQL
jgi:hypothetical protein